MIARPNTDGPTPQVFPPAGPLRRGAADRGLVALALVVYAASVAVPIAWLDRVGVTLCPVRGFTGLPCPGCGLTHAFLALGHGDVEAALRYNLLGLPLFLLGFAWLARALLDRRGTWLYLSARAAAWTTVGGTLLLLAYGLYRILVPSARPF